jgi:hypothetical protein
MTASEWQPMSTAPLDGTPIQATIPGHGSDNILAWEGPFLGDEEEDCYTWVFVEDQEPPACWDDGVCWTSNSDGKPSVRPVAWKPLP